MQKGIYAMRSKVLLTLLVAFMAVGCYGRPVALRKPSNMRHSSITWKHIAAAGAATGTVITAFKVSNGMEEGLKSIAQKDPKAFSDAAESIISPLKIIAWGLVLTALLASLLYVSPKIIQIFHLIRKDRNEDRDQQK